MITSGVLGVLLAGLAGEAWTQADPGSNLLDRPIPAAFENWTPAVPEEETAPRFFDDADPEPSGGDAPAPMRFPRPQEREHEGVLTLGGEFGYLKARGADHGSAYGGIEGRVRLLDHFSAEGSIGIHESEFVKGDLRVVQIPVQVTAYYFPISEGAVLPYLQAGIGWYYTKPEFRGSLADLPNRPQNIFGQHVGLGTEFQLGTNTSLDASFKYVIQQADIPALERRDLDYWQFTVGLSWTF